MAPIERFILNPWDRKKTRKTSVQYQRNIPEEPFEDENMALCDVLHPDRDHPGPKCQAEWRVSKKISYKCKQNNLGGLRFSTGFPNIPERM
jgi:hypothetical protein